MYKERDLNNKLVYFSIEWDEGALLWYMDTQNQDYEFISNKFTSSTLDKNIVLKEARQYIKKNSLVK